MALPTAQLGSLPNMSMPYSIPTYAKSSASQEAIASFLAGLAGSVGSNLGQNVMSRDYAETPAGFFSKLVSGPKENRQQYAQRLERAAAEQAATTAYERQTVESDIDRGFRQGIEDRRLEDARNARYLEAFLRGEDLKAAAKRDKFEWKQRADMQDAEMKTRLKMIQDEYGLRADLPSEKAKAAEAELLRNVINQQPGAQNPVQPAPLTPEEQAAMMTTPLPDRQVRRMANTDKYVEDMRRNGTNPAVIDRFLAQPEGYDPLGGVTPELMNLIELVTQLSPGAAADQYYRNRGQ